ncbi:MAG: DUF4838 domain-containing protein, partial [Clostridia bacterium]|nr:DUF4838 domain-containing protein [Clostridia bacterium]
EYILANPQAIYLCIAMEDKNTFCNCAKCKEKTEKYGGADKGGEAGLEIAFVNDVADECGKWLKENYPERRMQFVTYAYLKTLKPPVVYDSAQKKYVATHEDVITRENVSVMFCPISQDYFYGIDTPQNGINAEYFRGWQAICENVMVYEYSTDFSNYLINFNNFDTIQERVRFYGKKRLSFYFEQTSWGTNTPCFDAMRIYVTSQLLFNPSQNFNDLKNDFFKNYYKNASDAMLEYYDSLRSVYQRLKDDGLVKGTVYYKLLDANYWKLGTLLSFNKIFDKAFAAIESEKGDAALYEKLWDRINREKLSTMYMLCSLYRTDLSTDDYDQMVKDLEYYGGKYGIIYSREGGSYSALIADLKK